MESAPFQPAAVTLATAPAAALGQQKGHRQLLASALKGLDLAAARNNVNA